MKGGNDVNFKELRKRANLSLRQAADKIGVGFQSICRYENKGRIPKKEILLKMQKAYKCTDAELAEAILNNMKEAQNL